VINPRTGDHTPVAGLGRMTLGVLRFVRYFLINIKELDDESEGWITMGKIAEIQRNQAIFGDIDGS
jgi:hypothetical protein